MEKEKENEGVLDKIKEDNGINIEGAVLRSHALVQGSSATRRF